MTVGELIGSKDEGSIFQTPEAKVENAYLDGAIMQYWEPIPITRESLNDYFWSVIPRKYFDYLLRNANKDNQDLSENDEKIKIMVAEQTRKVREDMKNLERARKTYRNYQSLAFREEAMANVVLTFNEESKSRSLHAKQRAENIRLKMRETADNIGKLERIAQNSNDRLLELRGGSPASGYEQ